MNFVVHYAEIGLKGRNRPRFELQLRRNLERALSPLCRAKVRNLYGRLLLELPDDIDEERAASLLSRVFGVAFISRVTLIEPNLEAIQAAVEQFISTRRFESFGVRVRRVEKSHPWRSRDLESLLGARIQSLTRARVDLDHPDLWVELHMLTEHVVLLHRREAGPGGMPVGSAGRVVSLISGGIDSPVASWKMLKRGCELVYVHFHSAPYTSEASQEKVRDLVARLATYQGPVQLYSVPFGEIQQILVRDAPAEPRIVLYRRMMLRLAELIAKRENALALVTGESLGQVSSQTLGNLDTINRAATLPVLRPLVGMDKSEIIELAEQIGTYEISIEPDEDCCSYLMPRSPATWTRPEPISKIESVLDVTGMLEATLTRMQRERIRPAS